MQVTPKTRPDEKSFFENSTTWAARILILALLTYSPWNYGMVTWGQQEILTYWALGISGATLLALLFRKGPLPSFNLLLISLLVLLGIGLIQTIPLPNSIYDAISPAAKFEQAAVQQAVAELRIDESLLLDVAHSERQHETTLSIHPVQTRCSLSIFAAAIAILLCSAILFNDKLSRLVVLITLCSTSTALAILGILQSVSWNSWTLLPMPHSSNFATFVSRNSAPQYLSVGIGCALALIGIWKRAKDKRRKNSYQQRYPAASIIAKVRQVLEDLVLELDTPMVILISVLVTHIVAVVAAASRGGFVALLFSAGVCLLFFLANNRRWIVTGLAGLVVVTIVASMALDLFELDDELSARMQNLDTTARIELWTNSLKQSEYWLTGSGMGTFRFSVMPVNPLKGVWPHHAESIYAETAMDFGLIGLLLLIIGLGWLLVQLFPSEKTARYRLWPAALYCVMAIASHSFSDFSLIIPAIFVPLATIIGVFLAERGEKSSRSTSRSRCGNRLTIALILLGLMTMTWNGQKDLRGFAQAERVSQWFSNKLDEDPNLAGSLNSTSDAESEFPDEKFDFTHPEVVLVLSRIRLAALEASVRNLSDWPSSLPEAEQKQLSSAEFIAAVLRSEASDPQWQSRKSYFAKYPWITEQLAACNLGFQFASKACKLDWRAAWGRFQTLTNRDQVSDGLNWSRISRLCKSVSNSLEVLGTCCLIAGDKEMGVQSWKASVARNPVSASGLATLVGSLLSLEDVLSILPDSPIATARLCRALHAQDSNKSVALELLKRIDQSELIEVANDLNEWELVSWVMETLGNSDGLEASLRKIADLSPFDVMVRYRLAQQLEKKGQVPEAIKLLDQASRRSKLPPEVQAYLMKLRKN